LERYYSKKMAKETRLMPISDEEYAKMMITYKQKSDQDTVDCNGVMQPIIKKYAGKSIDMMSIGAGRGLIENEIIRHPDMIVNSMLLLEPNPLFAEELKEISAKWENTTSNIEVSYFDEHYETSKKFDVIIIVHSIVHIGNPVAVIMKLMSFLKDGGHIVVGIRGEKGGYELVSCMHEYMNREQSTSSSGSNFSGRSLVNDLEKHGIPYQIQESTALHDFTDFIEKKKTPTVNDTISLLLYAKYDDLESDLQNALYKVVKESAIATKDNKQMFGHSNCFIVIERV